MQSQSLAYLLECGRGRKPLIHAPHHLWSNRHSLMLGLKNHLTVCHPGLSRLGSAIRARGGYPDPDRAGCDLHDRSRGQCARGGRGRIALFGQFPAGHAAVSGRGTAEVDRGAQWGGSQITMSRAMQSRY